MATTRIRRFAVAVLLVVPMLAAGPASAAGEISLKSLTGHNVVNAFSSREVVDGSCPSSSDFGGPPFEDLHQLFGTDVVRPHMSSFVRVGISVCWVNTSAMGGDGVDTGTWELQIPGGALRGTVSGSVSNGRHQTYLFTLKITAPSGSLVNLYGSFTYFACGDEGQPLIYAALRTKPLRTDVPACSQ